MKLVLDRVWLTGENMVALLIRPKYLIWVREGLRDRAGENIEPVQLPDLLEKEKGNFRLLGSYRCGSDGIRMLAGKIPIRPIAAENHTYQALTSPATKVNGV